jgi:hypothetical protein
MNKVKVFITSVFVYMAIKIMGLFYKKEMKQMADKIKKASKIEAENRKKILNSMGDYYKSLPLKEKQKMELYTDLQNELLKVFVKYCQRMKEVDGIEMDGVRDLWAHTVLGLTKTFDHAFALQDDKRIKMHLNAVEQECKILIESNQEVLNESDNYGGPVGNA